MVRPRATTAVICDICGKTISRKADLPRHLKTHATNKEELMHACPYIGCTFKALQSSNLQTHLNVHSRVRPHKCPAEGCEFACSDPGSLTRHRKERHGYQPKGSSGGHPSADTRKAARRRRRISPYTTSPSPGGSASPTDSSTDTHGSPCLPLPKLPELYPSSSLLPADDHVEEGSKNAFAAYSTELITKRAQVNDAHLAPAPRPDNAPPLISGSGLLAASEAPSVAEYPQLAVPQQVGLYAVDVAAQPVPEMTNTGEAFDNFYDRFNDWQPGSPSLPAPVDSYTVDDAPVPASFPSPVVSYTVGDAPVPASFSSPVASYTADDALVPASFPSPVVSYAVDNALVPSCFPSPVVSYAVDDAPVPASLPSPVVSYMVDNVAVPVPASFPSPMVSYTADDALVPASFPSPMVSYTADDALVPASFPSPVVSYAVDDAPVPASFPSPVASYTVDDVPVPASFPSPMVSYTVDNATIPTPAFFPPYEVHYTINNAPFEYGGYGYTNEATSFETLFDFSNPASFTTPDIDVGVYPRATDVGQGYQPASYSYAAAAAATCAHTGTSFGMQGLYV